MTDSFDAYHRWLGIPPKHQPPDYYRLLGLEAFEQDPNVIDEAADRQMAHVRRHQMGEYAELSQKILNELATARLCLLDAEKNAEYAAKLKQSSHPLPKAKTLQAATPVRRPAPRPRPAREAAPARPRVQKQPSFSDAAPAGIKTKGSPAVTRNRWTASALLSDRRKVLVIGASALVVFGLFWGIMVPFVVLPALRSDDGAKSVAESDGSGRKKRAKDRKEGDKKRKGGSTLSSDPADHAVPPDDGDDDEPDKPSGIVTPGSGVGEDDPADPDPVQRGAGDPNPGDLDLGEPKDPVKPPEDPDKPKDRVKPPTDRVRPPPKDPDPFKPAKEPEKPDFAQLPAVVDLPPVDNNEPKELGKVQAAEDANWYLTLTGGEVEGKEAGRFTIERQDGVERWLVRFEKEARGGPEQTDVAEFAHQGPSLKFRWLKTAAEVPADHFRLCILDVDVADEAKSVTLIRPKKIEPITIDLIKMLQTKKKRPEEEAIELEWQPPSDKLRLQPTRLEIKPAVKKHSFQPNQPVPCDVAVGVVVFGQMDRNPLDLNPEAEKEFQALAFPLKLTGKRTGLNETGLVVEYGMMMMIPNPNAWSMVRPSPRVLPLVLEKPKNVTDEVWNAAAVQRQEGWKLASDQYWQKTIENIKKTPKPQLPDPQKNQLIALCTEMKLRYPWYFEFFNSGGGTGKIHYRISIEVGGKQVVLARTEAPAPKKGAGKGKNKGK